MCGLESEIETCFICPVKIITVMSMPTCVTVWQEETYQPLYVDGWDESEPLVSGPGTRGTEAGAVTAAVCPVLMLFFTVWFIACARCCILHGVFNFC